MDTGDNVIVINAAKVRVTGKKAEQKLYFRHTGYMGHERFMPFATMLEKHPERVIEKAVYGMLPKTALGRQTLRNKLRVFADAKHTHAAQQPKVLDLNKKSEKVMADSDAHDRPAQGSRLPSLHQAGLRQMVGERTHARRLFPAPRARLRHSAAVHRHRYARPL